MPLSAKNTVRLPSFSKHLADPGSQSPTASSSLRSSPQSSRCTSCVPSSPPPHASPNSPAQIWMRARRIYPDVAREYEQRKFLTEEAKRLAGEAPQLPRVRHESTLGMSMGHELEGRSKEGLLEGDLEKGEREHREVVYGGGSGLPTFTHVALGTSYDAQEQYPPYRHLPMGSEGTEVYHGEGPYGGVTSYAMPE